MKWDCENYNLFSYVFFNFCFWLGCLALEQYLWPSFQFIFECVRVLDRYLVRLLLIPALQWMNFQHIMVFRHCLHETTCLKKPASFSQFLHNFLLISTFLYHFEIYAWHSYTFWDPELLQNISLIHSNYVKRYAVTAQHTDGKMWAMAAVVLTTKKRSGKRWSCGLKEEGQHSCISAQVHKLGYSQ